MADRGPVAQRAVEVIVDTFLIASPDREWRSFAESLIDSVVTEATGGRLVCRCGRTVLPHNWQNHTHRKDGRPHLPVEWADAS